MKYAVLLLLDREVSETILDLREKICDKLECENKAFEPHISLRLNFESDDKLEVVKEKIKEISHRHSKLNIVLLSPSFFGEKIVHFPVERNPELQKLHEDVIKTVNSIRNSWVEDSYADLYEEELSKQVELYGQPYVMEKFNPHITIVNFNLIENVALDKENLKNICTQVPVPANIVVNRLVLVGEEENNSGWQIIDEYILK